MPRSFLLFAWLIGGSSLAACRTGTPARGAATAAAQSATTPPASLRNTRWVLRLLNNQPVATAGQEPYVLLRATGPRAEGHGGCNRFAGSFELPAEGQLRFEALLSTRMACADASSNTTESGFLSVLTATRTYQIEGDTLRLFAAAAAFPAAVLHAVYLR